ncbi:T9SS type A sorting domain-containing protein [uncultured Polaribacter sp.]|uniref:T9SS type A sorting domain-containing protein n=1 Tax=uncultured Polaribacter sp. TaxID=174711 RepID=UPI00260EEB4B|nr:T9SS type A sorting domain-containing protein [uncultured Polaribacter sp.]
MKYKIIFTYLFFFGLLIQAQETILTTGGKTSGIDGEINYSIGQIIYSTNTASNAKITQGIQQPYEIYRLLGVEQIPVNLALDVFPNPTSNFLNLHIEKDYLNFRYILYDLQGKIIENNILKNNTSKILTEKLLPSIYFLKVLKNNKTLRTFKILKK